MNTRVLVIGDLHFPFHCNKALTKLYALAKELKPTHIIQIGDLLDQYVFSKYARSMDVSPKEDIDFGLEKAVEMWQKLQNISKNAKCYQLMGNHDVRISKRISERLPEMGRFFSHKNFYKFENVKTMESDRDYLEIDGVIYVHGWLSKSLDHAKYFNKPTVHGHRHRPCIEFDNPKLWSMDVGFMADEKSLPLQYTPNRFCKWTKSCGIVINKEPRLILL